MQIHVLDLIPQYIRARNQGFQDYNLAYPELFRHYYRFWADVDDETVFPEDVIREKAELIRIRLPSIQKSFAQKCFSEEVIVVLFVGK